MDQRENELRREYQASAIWDKLWFKQIREMDLIRFTGDFALYLSRQAGGQVVDRIVQATAKLKNAASEDSLHLVGHSLGAVIFLDLLLSLRWDEPGVSGHDSAMAMRDTIYGSKKYVDVHDVLVPVDLSKESLPEGLLSGLAELFRQSVLAFIQSGVAHQSYWHSEKVAQMIAQLIQQARPQGMSA
ncbi:MAG: hypothetical protein JO202_01180 [Ktedonobacteraceae bacterium]|nr:hypothetical protein [Ktedonobacteraceae bacterium]